MSARGKRAGKRPPTVPKKAKRESKSKRQSQPSESAAASPRNKSSAVVNAQTAFIECIGAICLVEVTMHSLDAQEIAASEHEVLKRALAAMWRVHDWICDLKLDDLDGAEIDREDEP